MGSQTIFRDRQLRRRRAMLYRCLGYLLTAETGRIPATNRKRPVLRAMGQIMVLGRRMVPTIIMGQGQAMVPGAVMQGTRAMALKAVMAKGQTTAPGPAMA